MSTSVVDKFLRRFKDEILFTIFVVVYVVFALYCYRAMAGHGGARIGLMTIGAIGLGCSVGCYFALKRTRINPITMIVASSLVLGFMYIFIFGPFRAPDEFSHYKAAYNYSNLLLGVLGDGCYMRADDAQFFQRWYEATNNGNLSQYAMMKDEPLFLSDGSIVYTNGSNLNIGDKPPQQFLPAAIGMALGRLLGLGSLPTYYLGRITSLIAFLIMVCWSIRITPIGKPAFAVLSALPLVLELAGSCSYDGPLIGMSLITTAYMFKGIFVDQRLKRSDMIAIFLLSCLLAPCKIVYSVIIILVLFIPSSRFPSDKISKAFKALTLSAAALVAVASKCSSLFVLATGDEETRAADNLSRCYSLGDLLSDPLRYLFVLFSTPIVSMDVYLSMAFAQFGSLDVFPLVDSWTFTILFTALLLLAISAKDEVLRKVSPTFRASCMLLFCLCSLGFFVSMMHAWTPAGNPVILGVQGRYFFPIVPLLIPVLSNTRISTSLPGTKCFSCFMVSVSFLFSMLVYASVAIA